jgi:hypothetical protein
MRMVHRVGGVLGIALLVAAVAGLFGEGPAAHATAKSSDGSLQVDYDRFVRTAASTSFQITLPKGSGQTNFAISAEYLQSTSVGGVSPQASTETVLPDRVVFTVQETGSGQVQVSLTPEKIGAHKVTIWTHDAHVTFTTFTYP